MKTTVRYQYKNYTMCIAQDFNLNDYYLATNTLDEETAYLTGSKTVYSFEEIQQYYNECLIDSSRYDFLIFDGTRIIGEAVLSEIDLKQKNCHFRISLFNRTYCNKGIGTFAIKSILSFAFQNLNLHRVALEVFSFNTQAIYLYKKIGFVQEGIFRDAIYTKNSYADLICMALLDYEYFRII